jgi:ribosomal protein S18 acetylase RimI-like enzyme
LNRSHQGHALIHITEIIDITEDVMRGFSELIPQLSTTSPPPTADELSDIAANPNTVLLAARDSDTGDFIGTLTLAFFRIPTGLQARIEDVVVHEKARGRKVGRNLTNAAIEKARTAGAKSIGLTSRPSREAANGLYTSMGFERRDTNVYRLKLV